MNISEKISTRRKQLNLSLQDVADFVGVSKSAVFYWENGRTKSLKLDYIYLLAKKLKVEPSSLVYDDAPLEIVSGLTMRDLSELDQELISLVVALPFKEKIKLYNTLCEDKNEK